MGAGQLPFVKGVHLDETREPTTDVGPEWIGAPALWNGDSNSGVPNKGEGIVIGIIDSGFVHSHPSFAEVAPGDGYEHVNPLGDGNFLGLCLTTPGLCNNKLIGSYNFHPSTSVSEDTSGHGTHVASTAGGNPLDADFLGLTIPISGVAPRANLINYRVCFPGCPQTSSVNAVNQAIADGIVDVLNYSISGSDNPWLDIVDQAFLDAFEAGIYVSTSAGNTGPGPSTVAKTGPWNATVANSTHNRIFANSVDAAGLTDLGGLPGSGPAITADVSAPLVTASSLGNVEGCTPFPGGSMAGAIALIRRGSCPFIDKVTNAFNAGAVGVLMYNNAGGPPIVMGGLDAAGAPAIPSVMLDNASGLAVQAAADGASTATIYEGTVVRTSAAWGDVLAAGSSRGPSQFDLVKPDFAAPGTNILAAYYSASDSPVFGAISGTSMASPHGAGAAALLIKENPTWSPAEVKSALALTANPNMLKENGVTPSDPFDRGSGRIDLNGAARIPLVMDETHANFVAANPGIGGDPRSLNLPSLMNRDCVGGCSFTRTVTSTLNDSQDYTVETSAPAGITVNVTPSAFSLAAGADQVLTIDVAVDINTADLGSWNFGEVRLVPAAAGASTLVNESFTDVTFPPTGWTAFDVDGVGTQWARTTLSFNSTPASARHVFGSVANGDQDGWLVTPAVTLEPIANLRFSERNQFPSFYGKHSVWVSTDSCVPADGDFVEIAEVQGTDAWRTLDIDLSAFAGETVCVGFRYQGLDAATWYIDDVQITTASGGYPTLRMPLAVVPASPFPDIDVDVTSISSTQFIDQVVTQSFQISNSGGVDLNWSIAEAPTSVQIGLQLEDGKSLKGGASPFSLSLDGGVADTAVGIGGAQFLWLNRFTPAAYNFPITLDEVQVMFGSNIGAGGIAVGQLVDIYLYEDADGNPANGATHRASLTGQAVQAVDGSTWSVFSLGAPVTFDGPGDILVAVVNRTAGVTANTFPASIDRISGSQGRSWAGFGGGDPGNPPVLTSFTTFGVIDNLAPSLAGNWLVRGFGTGIVPCDNPSDVGWLSVDPAAGVVAAGGQAQVTVTLDSTGLAVGSYSALLCLESDDPDQALIEIPVGLEVQTPPEIELSETSLSGTAAHGESAQATFDIGNAGLGSLQWEASTSGPLGFAPMGTSPRVLFDNGPLITSIGNGPGGSDVSLLQNQSLGLTTLGASANLSGAGPHFRIADNFTVTAADGWDVRNIRFFAYQTGSTTTSSMTGVNLRIWDGVPGAPGSSVVFGDTSTNRIAGTGWTGAYRYAESAVGTTRPIMFIDATVNTVLPPGEYWLDWQLAGSIASGPWQPTVTILGQTVTGDARQLVSTGWQALVDGGNSAAQGAPFVISGFRDWCYDPNPAAWLSLSPDSGTLAGGGAETVTVTMNAEGLDVGTYEANVCVSSNDPNRPLVSVPVSFEVTQASQTIDFPSLADRTFGDAPFTIAATASSGLEVSFASLTGSVCSVTGDEVTLLAAGVCTIEASQAGNGNYLPAAPAEQSFDVLPAAQTIDFGALPDRQLDDSPFSVSASASSGLSVSFASLTVPVCLVSGDEVSLVAVGTCTIEASQDGDGNYLPANPVSQSFEVTLIPQTIDFAALDDRLIGDSPFTVSATASSGLEVSFASLTGSVCSVSGDEVSLLAVGTCSIEASQDGDATYEAAAPVVQSFEVIEAEVLVSPGSLPRGAIDAPYSVTFTASGTGTTAPFTFEVTDGALPDGLVLATDGELSGTPTVDGVFEFTVTATDSSSADVGGPFSGSRAYTLIVEEEFIFFDGFEAIGPLLKLLFERAGVHKVELPLAGSLAALPAGSSAVIGEVLLKGERVAQIEAQCLDQGCALRLRATDAAKAGSDSRWLSIQSEPFGLVVELSESALLKASSQD